MTVNSQRLLLAAAGAAAAGEGLYIDDVFSTYLYTGTGSTQTITNGIDLSGEGGMVWCKQRDSPGEYGGVIDTERGRTKVLYTAISNAELTTSSDTADLVSFNSDGFTLGSVSVLNANHNTKKNVSWTFRKAPGFFDIQTWSGTGTNGNVISHDLGSTPGFIIVKERDGTGWWTCWHRSLGGYRLFLNDTGAATAANIEAYFGDGTNYVAPTSTNFTVSSNDLNESGKTYVAYIFAHDDQSFGEDEDESIIKCGTFSGTGFVDLGWEPQWIMIKPHSQTYNWEVYDNMRGMGGPGGQSAARALYPNLSNAEANASGVSFEATGFTQTTWGSTYPCVYVAIRRPHKPPEAGTDVFKALTYTGDSGTRTLSADFSPDLAIGLPRNALGDRRRFDARLTSKKTSGYAYNYLTPSSNSAENSITSYNEIDFNKASNEVEVTFNQWGGYNYTGTNYATYLLRRAPGFFDVVAYTGTGVARTVPHNLGVEPELMIIKDRTTAYNWGIFAQPLGNTKFLEFNTDLEQTSSTIWNNTSPSSSVFALGTNVRVNSNGDNHIAYLFATLTGISKVGSYTGTGSNIGVDCGFTAGARFVLIKRTDSTGDWYVYDSTRGIVGGNDPYILLNSTAAETTTTDYIDPLNSGFTVTSSAPAALNASGGTYIFLAIA